MGLLFNHLRLGLVSHLAKGGDAVTAYCRSALLPIPLTEHRFHKTRRWRFDWAWAYQRVALELEGGVYSAGRHTRGSGFTNDCIKYAEAALAGWVVLRCTTGQFKSGIWMDWLERALRPEKGVNRERELPGSVVGGKKGGRTAARVRADDVSATGYGGYSG